MAEKPDDTSCWTHEDLLKDYERLKKLMVQQAKEHAAADKELLKLQRECEMNAIEEQDFLNQLKSHEEDIQSEKRKLKELQEGIVSIEDSHGRTVEELKAKLAVEEEDLRKLKAERDEKDESFSGAEDLERASDELATWKDQESELSSIVKELRLSLKVSERSHVELKAQAEDAKLRLIRIEENCKAKEAELRERTVFNESLEKQLQESRNEVERLKSNPKEAGPQGKSIFAEVNDRRVELQEEMSSLKEKYLQLKHDHKGLELQVKEQRQRKSILSKYHEEDIQQFRNDDVNLQQAYEMRVKVLKFLINIYKSARAMRHVFVDDELPDDFMEILDKAFKDFDKEIKSVSDEFKKQSLYQALVSRVLHRSEIQLAEWKSKCALQTEQVSAAKSEIESAKAGNRPARIAADRKPSAVHEQRTKIGRKNPETHEEKKVIKIDVMTYLNEIAKSEEQAKTIVKEECGENDCEVAISLPSTEDVDKKKETQKKCIKFAEDTAFVDMGDRNRCRKPGKRLIPRKVLDLTTNKDRSAS